MRKITLQLLIFLGALFLNATQSKAFIYDIPQPGQREFIQDLAGLIDENHQQEIKQAADKILTQTGNPIIVVTINKMADHLDKGKTLRIETFAHFLFDQWEIGLLEIGMFLMFLGIFVYTVLNAISKAPLLQKNHPFLEESKHHEY